MDRPSKITLDPNGIQNIIFDLGDVVINISPERCYQAFAALLQMDLDHVVEQFNELLVFEKYEAGLISDRSFLDLLHSISDVRNTDDELIWAWQQILLDIPIDRIETMQALSKNYRLFVLSNTSHYHMVEVHAILERASGVKRIDDLVEKAYYSFEMGVRKPDSRIYKMVLEGSGLKPEETLFLDDNLQNIMAAKEIGMETMQIDQITGITECLQAFI